MPNHVSCKTDGRRFNEIRSKIRLKRLAFQRFVSDAQYPPIDVGLHDGAVGVIIVALSGSLCQFLSGLMDFSTGNTVGRQGRGQFH